MPSVAHMLLANAKAPAAPKAKAHAAAARAKAAPAIAISPVETVAAKAKAKAKAHARAASAEAKAHIIATAPVTASTPAEKKAQAAVAKKKEAAAKARAAPLTGNPDELKIPRGRLGKGQNDHNGVDHAIFCFSCVTKGTPLSKEDAIWCCRDAIGMVNETDSEQFRGVFAHEGTGKGDTNDHYQFAAFWSPHRHLRNTSNILRKNQERFRNNEKHHCNVQAQARFKSQLFVIYRLCLYCCNLLC
jgi:hypothetical protein